MFWTLKKNRLRRWLIVALITLICVCAAEFAISNLLARQLRSLVADRLDADLTVGRLWYIPPFGVYLSDAALWRDQERIMSIGPTRLRLARIPLPHRAIVIQKLYIDDPIVQLTRTNEGLMGGPGLVKKRPTTRKREPRKLSDVLQLRHLRLTRGRVEYLDQRPVEPLPVVWNDINIDVNLDQRSASNYSYEMSAHTGASANLKATGAIDVDSLLLESDNVLINLTARRDSAERALPAQMQRILDKYEVEGELAIAARATLPLRDINSAAYAATIELQHASGWIQQMDLAVEDTNLKLELWHGRPSPRGNPAPESSSVRSSTTATTQTSQPAPPFILRLLAFETRAADVKLKLDRGQATINFADQEWSLDGISGHLTMQPPTTQPDFNARDLMARMRPAGHIDFTASGGGPIVFDGRRPTARVVDYQFIAYPQNLAFSLAQFPLRFERVGGGMLRVQYGVLTLENLSAAYGHDNIRIARARLPIDGLPRTIALQEISATATMSPPLQPYPPKLMKILDSARPSGPFVIGGNVTLNTTTRPVKPDYNLMISSDTAALELTKWRLPLTNVRGDFTLTPQRIATSRLEADLFDGRVTANGFFEPAPPGDLKTPTRYAGEIFLEGAKLQRFDEHFRPQRSGRKLAGDVELHATFAGGEPRSAPPLTGLNSTGEVEIIQGDLFRLPVLSRLLQNVRAGDAATTVGQAAATFTIKDRTITLADAAISSPTVGLQGGGDIAFDGKLDLEAIVAPLADWKDQLQKTNLPLLSNVFADLAGGVQRFLNSATSTLLYQFRIEGTLKNPAIKPVPAPVLADGTAFVFGRMLQGVKDGDLLKTVRQSIRATDPHDKKKRGRDAPPS